MVFEGANYGQARNAGIVEQVFRPSHRVLAHEFPFVLFEVAGFVEDFLRDELFSDVVQHGRNTDIVEELPLEAEGHPLGQIEDADIEGVGEGILVHLPERDKGHEWIGFVAEGGDKTRNKAKNGSQVESVRGCHAANRQL